MTQPAKSKLPLIVALLFFTIVACRLTATPAPSTPVSQATTGARAATATAPATAAVAATASGGETPETARAPATSPPPSDLPGDDFAPVALPLPESGLFDFAWQDRGPYESGLVDPDEAHLPQLQGASVYHMDLELSSDAGRLEGRQEILYTNQEDGPLQEVYFRLFPNLAGGQTSIAGLWLNGQAVLPTYELRDSAMRVPLQPPLAPGEAVVVSMNYTVEIPTEGGGNYGTFIFNRDILALAHFYPMIAVYDDEGWNLEIAPESGDVVYADSSFYLVRFNAPAGMRLAASGVEIAGGAGGERQEVTYAAGPARDFYIAGSAGFDVYSEVVGSTLVNSYAFPERETRARDVLDWAVASLQSFEAQIGPYPYTELDLVTTPTLALGVEYPGIIAMNMDLYDPQASPLPPAVLESTTAHEVAHQWFYAVVGNDQLDDPWLDEALAQYATYLYFLDTGGEEAAEGFRSSLERRWQAVDREEIPIGRPVAAYQGPEYSAIVYGRGPLFFEALAQTMGDDIFSAFLQDYYRRLRWDIATPERLQTIAEEHCRCDLGPLFIEWVYDE